MKEWLIEVLETVLSYLSNTPFIAESSPGQLDGKSEKTLKKWSHKNMPVHCALEHM